MSNQLLEFFPFFAALLRSSQHALAFVSDENRILFASESFAELLGLSAESLEGENVFDYLRLRDATSEEVLAKKRFSGQCQVAHGDCALQLCRTAPASGKRPGYVLELYPARDLGESAHRPSGERRRSQLESLGILSSGIAHDLNNILAGILGHVSFLRLSLPMSGTDEDSLKTIEQGTRKAAQLTKQILEFAQGQGKKHSAVSLAALVEDVVQLIRRSVPDGVSVETNGLELPLHAVGDEAQLSQLLLNLAVNARDAVDGSGTIKIEIAGRSYLDAAACADLGIQPGEYVVLSVKDTGPGIEGSIRNRIFEPFFTTKEEKGTGLGLATVQAIVKSHRGLLIVDSAPGQGTCFEIALPKAATCTVPIVKEQQGPRAVPRGTERVLIVDDEDAVRLIMEKSLEHLGYEVVTATNGEQALSYFGGKSFKLVILDMIMPGMAGDEVFSAMQQRDPSVPVLIASGYASDARIRSMLAGGALGYIQKPFSVEELADEVRRCLDKAERQKQGIEDFQAA